MSQYSFYKLHLSQYNQTSILPLTEGEDTAKLKTAQATLSDIIGNHDYQLQYNGKGGKTVTALCDLLRNEQDIFLLRVHHEENVSIFDRVEQEGQVARCNHTTSLSYPYSYVIVDNREGRSLMGVQRSTLWSDPYNTVCSMMTEALQSSLRLHHELDLTSNSMMKPTEVWSYVHERCVEYHDAVEKIEIELLNPTRYTPVDTGSDSTIADQLFKMTRSIHAIKSLISIDTDTRVDFDTYRRNRDLAHIVSIGATNAFNLNFYFRDHGCYRCNENVPAVFEIDDKLVDDFINRQTDLADGCDTPVYRMIQRLDEIDNQTKDYIDHATPRKKKKRTK